MRPNTVAITTTICSITDLLKIYAIPNHSSKNHTIINNNTDGIESNYFWYNINILKNEVPKYY